MHIVLTFAQTPTSDQILSGASAPTPTTGVAQSGTPRQSPAPLPPNSGPGYSMLIMMGAVIGVMLLVTSLAKRKENKKRDELLNAVKKGDRVLTYSGIFGTVAEVRDDSIVLRVDENANTKIRFHKSAIQQNLTPASAAAPATSSSDTPPQVEVKAKNGSSDRDKVGV